MRPLLLAAALSVCATLPEPYRTPADPGAFWIWETREAADRWMREHPGMCERDVADGFATERC